MRAKLGLNFTFYLPLRASQVFGPEEDAPERPRCRKWKRTERPKRTALRQARWTRQRQNIECQDLRKLGRTGPMLAARCIGALIVQKRVFAPTVTGIAVIVDVLSADGSRQRHTWAMSSPFASAHDGRAKAPPKGPANRRALPVRSIRWRPMARHTLNSGPAGDGDLDDAPAPTRSPARNQGRSGGPHEHRGIGGLQMPRRLLPL